MDLRRQTCCFTGHRAFRHGEEEGVRALLEGHLRRLIEAEGVRFFGAGGALGFDTLAERTVLSLKADYPHIRLILVLPCRDQDRLWRPEDRAVYAGLLARADKVVYAAEAYHSGCMQRRNRRLVDGSAWCLCYQYKNTGGTAYTVDYALRRGLRVFNCLPCPPGQTVVN